MVQVGGEKKLSLITPPTNLNQVPKQTTNLGLKLLFQKGFFLQQSLPPKRWSCTNILCSASKIFPLAVDATNSPNLTSQVAHNLLTKSPFSLIFLRRISVVLQKIGRLTNREHGGLFGGKTEFCRVWYDLTHSLTHSLQFSSNTHSMKPDQTYTFDVGSFNIPFGLWRRNPRKMTQWQTFWFPNCHLGTGIHSLPSSCTKSLPSKRFFWVTVLPRDVSVIWTELFHTETMIQMG